MKEKRFQIRAELEAIQKELKDINLAQISDERQQIDLAFDRHEQLMGGAVAFAEMSELCSILHFQQGNYDDALNVALYSVRGDDGGRVPSGRGMDHFTGWYEVYRARNKELLDQIP